MEDDGVWQQFMQEFFRGKSVYFLIGGSYLCFMIFSVESMRWRERAEKS